jgi:hypothetical protein
MSSSHDDRAELLQGTPDLIVLRALATMGRHQHTHTLAVRAWRIL